MNRETAIISFKAQLLREYEKTQDIVRCFYIYLGFLKEYSLQEYVEFTQWQMDDMIMSIYNEHINPIVLTLETAWNYGRREGKSKNLSIIATFFSLLNKDVIWRTYATDQLAQASKWFMHNPCVKKERVSHDNYVEIYDSPLINIGVLSKGKVASRGADLLIFDELGMVEKDHKNFEYYHNARGMIKDSKFKHIINTSTPAKSTAFHDIWLSLEELEIEYNTRFTSTHGYRDCHWISEEDIELERKKHKSTPWFIQQNYEALWVNYGGDVFTNVIYLGDPRYVDKDCKLIYHSKFMDNVIATHGGVDFNGKNTQHYLVLIKYDDKYVYVLKEITFLDLWTLEAYEHLNLEVEDGLFNSAFTKQLKRMGISCSYKPIDEYTKKERIEELCNRTIIIDRIKCPQTYKNLTECSYDRKARMGKIKKTADQHGLDALIMAFNGLYHDKIYVANRKQKQTNVFGERSTIYNQIYI